MFFYHRSTFFRSSESQPEGSSEEGEDDGINFMQFVKVLARFRRAENGKPQPLNSNNHKLDCKYFEKNLVVTRNLIG